MTNEEVIKRIETLKNRCERLALKGLMEWKKDAEACEAALSVLRSAPTSEALTLDQLREMEGKPAWIVPVNDKDWEPHWAVMNDRETWSGCVCNTEKNCCTCVSLECHACIRGSKYKMGRYCSACGRPLTEEAWAELEKRLRG